MYLKFYDFACSLIKSQPDSDKNNEKAVQVVKMPLSMY